MSKDTPSKTWVYTLNNNTEQELTSLKALTVNKHRCCAENEGTPHLQGSVTFTRSYRLTQLRKLFPRCHWEVAKARDSENYCIKGEIIIDIDNKQQGKRSDILEASKTSTMYECAKMFPVEYIKYNKGLEKLQNILQSKELPTFIKMEVIVFWGQSGSGKSKRARELDPNLYNVPEPINGTVWFDGYDGEDTILLDDFYGWLKYHTLLQFLDGYKMMVPVKGGFTQKRWKRVIITSNKPPEEWYMREEIDALKRRLNTVEFVTVTEVE